MAAWIVRSELKRYGHDPELAGSVVATADIGGLLGARLLFILVESFLYGVYAGLVYTPIYNFYSKKWG